jgi:hypothetical protein
MKAARAGKRKSRGREILKGVRGNRSSPER